MERRKKRRRLIEIVKDVLIALLALSGVVARETRAYFRKKENPLRG